METHTRNNLTPWMSRLAWALAFLGLCQAICAAGAPRAAPAVQWERCVGWGACWLRLPQEGERLVRLRGVGNPAWDGVCPREGPMAAALRAYVEGVLRRAGTLELEHVVPLGGQRLLATVRADGVDVAEVIIHAGMGRYYPVRPEAGPCES
ncbi:MAG TPA: hypothetical protein VL359_02425 [bacterium]|nr:hypothetical protein [bacterium]